MATTKTYRSTGLVFGNFWGGGKGAYPARQLQAKSVRGIIKQAREGLNGSLDSGMGYASLIGAILYITETTTIVVDEKAYTSCEQLSARFVGKLTQKQKDFLVFDCE